MLSWIIPWIRSLISTKTSKSKSQRRHLLTIEKSNFGRTRRFKGARLDRITGVQVCKQPKQPVIENANSELTLKDGTVLDPMNTTRLSPRDKVSAHFIEPMIGSQLDFFVTVVRIPFYPQVGIKLPLKQRHQTVQRETEIDTGVPYITLYTPLTIKPSTATVEFEYLGSLREFRTLFLCQEKQSGRMLVVKFVTRYSPAAHLDCAKRGCAPQLYGFEEVPGGWYMVVMEYLSPELYGPFTLSSNKDLIRDATKQHIITLHKHGYMHGDVRRSNILIGANNLIKLVDFDWAGKIGEARYPTLVNPALDGFNRPAGAEDENLIMVEHDLEMVEHLLIDPPSWW